MMRRKRLLLTAVVTVTVPGLLAVLAILGHEHAAAAAADTSAGASSAGTGSAAGPGAASRTLLGWATVTQRALGLRLLTEAATAGQSTSYQGTELIAQSGVGGSVQTVSQVRHGAGSTSPEGVFGVTRPLVSLLGQHYVAVYQGAGTASGRTAEVVGLYRFNGSLAARYWLDKRTTVPLTRELYDTAEQMIGKDSFVRVRFGALLSPVQAGPAARSAQLTRNARPAQAWSAQQPAARFRTSLASQGWPVPVSLPGGLPLYSAASAKTTAGQVADFEYSDGLYVASLFVQRGSLTPDMAGWRRVRLAGGTAYVSGHSVAWTSAGFVYTMIADAPAQTVTGTVDGLIDNVTGGFLDRLGRGLARLARLANPFG